MDVVADKYEDNFGNRFGECSKNKVYSLKFIRAFDNVYYHLQGTMDQYTC